jgi:hypothetical protein
MKVPDNIRKCVVFIGYKMADGEYRLGGSGFFLGTMICGNQSKRTFLVTAKHVIDGVRKTGIKEVQIRVNNKDGNASWIETKLDDWFHHPSDESMDVSLHEMGIPPESDHLVIPDTIFATDKVFSDLQVGLGDEVFIVGLFKHHQGNLRNIPIVRIGNLSATNEEKLRVKGFGEIEAYLIEARSIGGLSGSPVFLNLGKLRLVDGGLKQTDGETSFYMLGLIHGHFDEESIIDGETEDSKKGSNAVNTGIAIVVPFSTIDRLIGVYLSGTGHGG